MLTTGFTSAYRWGGIVCAARPGTFRRRDRFNADMAFQAQRRSTMNWDRVSGNWKQFKGKVKEQWGKLTDDEIDQINGNREQLEGKIQERYGIAKDAVKKQVDDAMRRW
jgi:uncharacterized protein YjbJ (UPF0337 family)